MKYKENDHVLYVQRKGMGIPGRLSFAKISRINDSSYDCEMVNCKPNGWGITLFETDIVTKVSAKEAATLEDMLAIRYATLDQVRGAIDTMEDDINQSVRKFCANGEE